MIRDPILAMIAADPNVDPALGAVFNEGYTPEELAIEAEERAADEAAREQADRDEWLAEKREAERRRYGYGSGE